MGRTYVEVEVDLDDFDDQDLIDEIESRGWRVVEDSDYAPEDLTSEEIAVIVGAFQHCKPGTIGNSVYEKLRKR